MTRQESPALPSAITSTEIANEWGIPNWDDPSAYGDTKKWKLIRWIWEFTRRRGDYRDETQICLDLYNEREKIRIGLNADPTAEARCAYNTLTRKAMMLWAQYRNNWGYDAPLDPRVSEFPDEHLLRWPLRGVSSMRGSPIDAAPDERNRLIPAPDQLAITVNLDRPLAEQLELVERAAKKEQKARHGRLLQTRRHPDKWLGYLRVLDAREAGKTWAEMTDTFYRQGVLERRTDPSGGYCAPPPQASRDLWEAARALRFNF